MRIKVYGVMRKAFASNKRQWQYLFFLFFFHFMMKKEKEIIGEKCACGQICPFREREAPNCIIKEKECAISKHQKDMVKKSKDKKMERSDAQHPQSWSEESSPPTAISSSDKKKKSHKKK